MHVIAGKAVAFKEALDPSFKEYMTQVVKNADTLANALIEEGFDIVSGGTDNHLMLVDLKKYDLTGKEAEKYWILYISHVIRILYQTIQISIRNIRTSSWNTSCYNSWTERRRYESDRKSYSSDIIRQET